VPRSLAILVAASSLVCPVAQGQQDDLVPLPVKLDELPSEQTGTRFRTHRFEISSDAPIQRDQAAKFSQVIDSVPMAVSRLPLPLLAPPEGELPRIQVVTRAEDYQAAGGPAGTAGFYDSRGPRLLVLRRHLLNSPADATSRLGPSPNQDLLVHELGHLCMHRYLGRTPQWFAEGACEYLACLHHADGRFRFRNPDAAIREHLRSRFNPRDPLTPVTSIKHLAGLSGDGWTNLTNHMPAQDRYRNYATALLLFHYHLQGGAERLENTRRRLETSLIQRNPSIQWLDPQEITSLQQSLTRFWQPRGLQLRFVDP